MKNSKKLRILHKLYKQLHSLYIEHNNPYNPYYAYDYLKGTIAVDYRCTDEGYKRIVFYSPFFMFFFKMCKISNTF